MVKKCMHDGERLAIEAGCRQIVLTSEYEPGREQYAEVVDCGFTIRFPVAMDLPRNEVGSRSFRNRPPCKHLLLEIGVRRVVGSSSRLVPDRTARVSRDQPEGIPNCRRGQSEQPSASNPEIEGSKPNRPTMISNAERGHPAKRPIDLPPRAPPKKPRRDRLTQRVPRRLPERVGPPCISAQFDRSLCSAALGSEARHPKLTIQLSEDFKQ